MLYCKICDSINSFFELISLILLQQLLFPTFTSYFMMDCFSVDTELLLTIMISLLHMMNFGHSFVQAVLYRILFILTFLLLWWNVLFLVSHIRSCLMYVLWNVLYGHSTMSRMFMLKFLKEAFEHWLIIMKKEIEIPALDFCGNNSVGFGCSGGLGFNMPGVQIKGKNTGNSIIVLCSSKEIKKSYSSIYVYMCVCARLCVFVHVCGFGRMFVCMRVRACVWYYIILEEPSLII